MYLKCTLLEEKEVVVASVDPNDWKSGGYGFEGGSDIHYSIESSSISDIYRNGISNYEGGWGGAGGNDWGGAADYGMGT